MMRKWLSLLAVTGATAAAVAYAVDTKSVYVVDSHRFAVPDDRLFKARIPWLPAPKTTSFTFVLDRAFEPNLIPPHRVLVEAREDVCGDGQAQMLKVACGREKTRLTIAGPFVKSFPTAGYPYAWDYYAEASSDMEGGRSERLQVAYCSPISSNPARPKGTAICRTVWNVDGLVLSLGFEEHELTSLQAMRDRATNMLLSWEVRPQP